LLLVKKQILLSIIDKKNNTSQMQQTFGEYIRYLRLKEGFTLTQLGAKLGIDSANLSKIENGKREFDEKRLMKLAATFQLDLEQLKIEFFGDFFAKKLFHSKCSTEALSIAEEKIKYLRTKSTTQSKLKFNDEE